MPTTLGFKPLIDLPEWRPIANAGAASAAGTQLVAGLRNNSDRGAYVYMLVNATTLWAYDVEDDDWFQLASPGLTGTFGAGAGAVMMPSQGPRGTLAAGGTTTSVVLSTALPAAVAPNQLANKGNSNGFKIRIIGNSAGGSGKVEERYIIGNTGGTTPTLYLDSALSFTPANGDGYEILSGRLFMSSAGTLAAGCWKYYDIATNSFSGILDEFRRAGVEVLIAELPESANGASGRLLTNLLSSFAEFERDMTTSRIADTRARLVARGRRIADRIPFGYSTDPKTKQLVSVPREAGIVKTMFELVADGVKTSVVEETALLRNWRTRSGKPWTARQILDTVSNPVYIGHFRAPQGIRPSVHQTIIDEALFQRCGDAIAARRTGSVRRRRSHSGINWIVRGLLYCGGCGRLMGSHTVRVRSVISRYYRCRSTAGGRKPCKGVMVNAHAIESAVLAELGVGSRLSSKDQSYAVKELAGKILFDAASGKVRIELIKPPDDSARDEAEATGQRAATGRCMSGPRHR